MMAGSRGGKSGGKSKDGGDSSLPPLSLDACVFLIARMALSGASRSQIAAVTGVKEGRLDNYYRPLMKRCAAIRASKVADVVREKALSGDLTAAVFWLRHRANWRDGHIKNELKNILSPTGPS